MKNYNKYLKKVTAGLMVAVMSTLSISSTVLADNEVAVVISEYGPLSAAMGESQAAVTSEGLEVSVSDTVVSETSTNGTAQVVEAGNSVTVQVSDTSTSVAQSSDGTQAVDTASGTSQSAQISETAAADQVVQTSETTNTQVVETSSGTENSLYSAPTAEAAQVSETEAASEQTTGTAVTDTTTSLTTGTFETFTESNSAKAEIGSFFQTTTAGTGFVKTALTANPDVNANFMILVDADSDMIVAEKNGDSKMYPASMTKVMTLLVACEHITDLDQEVEITSDIIDYVNDNDASNCGFKAGEIVTVKDLLYGLILPSGADAALALVRLIAGSEKQFVNLMNEKAQEIGISATTHYTNCTGLYDDNHYTTAKDMALVMKYAASNPYASAVLSTRNYTTKANNKHSSGISFSNKFLTRIDSQSTGGKALMAKTGYVSKAGNCAVSSFTGPSGSHYICVTGKTSGAWNVVYAHADLYKQYGK
ncbi:D-alanyl-D-alanine carboxypeptidase family protein [Oribacterium sp. KHPX15]|uniref:D-alanyl-D-alanine carboxypeptidase family protein n=1 Tax=Oribacterium sp. KHPX15 TaxID=1855342 RepID=UPI001586FE41|nr:serine hydrolase [Oribacterium sp. KHPX15]